ncbi:hypothetical protein [Microbacterium sp.]|uniref:hypothetical protein n=1 Tax=Microbacterium sp. TaxID=51671 RepID=UPI0027341A47|nr:hypothetical protein [Microbacterium sp.]MDP3951603.1 hypothetical protein [Microbacterium sp.]
MPPPFRIAESSIWLRLQRTGDAQPLDSTFGTKARTRDDQYEDEILLRGMPRFAKSEVTVPRFAGDSPMTVGHVTFTYDVLEAAGLTAARLWHARVVGYGRRGTRENVDYQIHHVEPRGHLAGGPIFVKAHVEKFKDALGAVA